MVELVQSVIMACSVGWTGGSNSQSFPWMVALWGFYRETCRKKEESDALVLWIGVGVVDGEKGEKGEKMVELVQAVTMDVGSLVDVERGDGERN